MCIHTVHTHTYIYIYIYKFVLFVDLLIIHNAQKCLCLNSIYILYMYIFTYLTNYLHTYILCIQKYKHTYIILYMIQFVCVYILCVCVCVCIYIMYVCMNERYCMYLCWCTVVRWGVVMGSEVAAALL